MSAFTLHEAAAQGDLEMVRLWLEQGEVSLNDKDPQGFTPLDWAVKNDHPLCVKELLGKGAKTDSKHLFFAASQGKDVMLKILLQSKGLDVNVRERKNLLTPLHVASENKHIECAKLLLLAGADPNIRNKREESALHLASKQKNLQLIQLLLQHGANPTLSNSEGTTPLNLVSSSEELTALLQRHVPPSSSSNQIRSPEDEILLENLKKQLDSKQKEIEQLLSQQDEQLKQQSNIESLTSQLEQSTIATEKAIAQKEKLIEELQTWKAKYDDIAKSSTVEKNSLKQQIDSIERLKLDELKELGSIIHFCKTNSCSKANQKDIQIHSLSQDLESVRTQFRDTIAISKEKQGELDKKLSETIETLRQTQNQLQSKEQEIQKIKMELQSNETTHREQLLKYEQEAKKQQDALENSKKLLGENEQLVSKWKQEAKQIEQTLTTQLKDLESQLNQAREELTASQSRNRSLETAIKTAKSEAEAELSAQWASTQQGQEQEIRKLTKQVKDLQSQLEQKEQAYHTEREHLQQAFAQKTQESEKSLKDQIEKASDVSSKLTKAEQQVLELRKTIEQNNHERSNQTNLLKELQSETTKLKESKSKLEKELEAEKLVRIELEEEKEVLLRNQDHTKELERELSDLKIKVASLEESKHKLEKHNATLSDENKKLNEDMEYVSKLGANSKVKGYKDIIQQYLSDNYRLEEELKELKRIYFQSVAISTKMNLSNSGIICNVSVSALFDTALQQNIDFKLWPQWITQQMSAPSNT